MRSQHNSGVGGEGAIKKIAEEYFGSATPGQKKKRKEVQN